MVLSGGGGVGGGPVQGWARLGHVQSGVGGGSGAVWV